MTMTITYFEFHINLIGSFENGKNRFSVIRPELQGSMAEYKWPNGFNSYLYQNKPPILQHKFHLQALFSQK